MFYIPNYIICISFLASVQFSYLQEMPCYHTAGKRKAAFWSCVLFRCGKAAASATSKCVFCLCANILRVTDREVWQRLTAAAVCPYLLINIAVVCTTFSSSVCICMIIHQIHFPWSTRGNGKRGSSGWHPQTPAPACMLASRERQRS